MNDTSKSFQTIPTNPIPGTELRGSVVMACSVLELQELLEEQRQQIRLQARILEATTQILKGFTDLYEELTEKTAERQFLSRAVRRAEREAARIRLPLWFWRPEPGVELKVQLYRRAHYLVGESYSVDDIWDLLREYVAEWAKPEREVRDDQLSRLIEYALRKGGK